MVLSIRMFSILRKDYKTSWLVNRELSIAKTNSNRKRVTVFYFPNASIEFEICKFENCVLGSFFRLPVFHLFFNKLIKFESCRASGSNVSMTCPYP